MTQQVLGPKGSPRRRWTLLMLPLAALAALVVVLAGSAANSPPPVLFEIEGNLEAGVPGTGTTAAGTDWINLTDNAGPDVGALQCPGNAATCTPAQVIDGPAPGDGELFRDDLKVDPGGDNTTFTQGDKENDFANATCPPGTPTQPCVSDTPWHLTEGSTPPNKDDLFDVASNTFVAGAQSELDLGMLRTENNGSSHVDFELNRLSWLPGATTGVDCLTNKTGIANFKCPRRTEGDLLISFEISPSSDTPPVSVQTRLFVWDLPGGTDANGHGRGNVNCEGPLSGNENTCPWEEIPVPQPPGQPPAIITAVNAAAIPAGPWGSRQPNGDPTTTIPAGGWFETAIDLDRLGFPPTCPGFGTASAKARSSGSSVTSALTDLAGPFPVNLDVCGKLTIIKDAQPDGAQDFSYTTTGGLSPSTFDLDDDANATLSNTKVYDPLSPGNYSITEGTPGGGYAFSSVSCTIDVVGDGTSSSTPDNNTRSVAVHLGNNSEMTCTFVNVLQRSLIFTKTAKDASTGSVSGQEPLGGVSFVISPDPTDGVGTLSLTDLFAGEASGTDQFRAAATGKGKICVDLGTSVSANSFSITESVPTGYAVQGANPKTGIAPATGTCSSRGTSATADAAFVNDPLSTITVTFSSQATGASGPATAANINCSPSGTHTEQGNADPAFDDTLETFADLKEGQVICTINIDP